MRLVLLGDLHFYQLGVWPWQLFSKRLLGQANLWINRRRHFQPSLWPEVAKRVRDLRPEAVLGSGDFTTTALPGEFEQARQHWAGLVDDLELSGGAYLVPGNHDRYCFVSKRKRLFEKAFGEWTSDTWPRTWELGDAAVVIGLDPTRPNLFNASGALGERQLQKLKVILEQIPAAVTVLVLCHYPIGTPPELPPESPGHGLQDAEDLRRVLAEAGRPLTYLHGHIHWPWVWQLPEASQVTVVNAGAPMLTGPRYPRGQGFVEIQWPAEDGVVAIRRHQMRADGAWESHAETPQ